VTGIEIHEGLQGCRHLADAAAGDLAVAARAGFPILKEWSGLGVFRLGIHGSGIGFGFVRPRSAQHGKRHRDANAKQKGGRGQRGGDTAAVHLFAEQSEEAAVSDDLRAIASPQPCVQRAGERPVTTSSRCPA